jgi:DnaK suppressor protein
MFIRIQQERLRERLRSYRKKIAERDKEYGDLKISIAIPRILLALEKIEGGTYGYCDDCGCEIPLKRLETIPAAILCVQCQYLDEEKIKRGGQR